MGLDQYLYAQTRGEPLTLGDEMPDELYEQIHWRSPDWETEEWFRKAYMTPEQIAQDDARPYQITKVAYWRKANQIHAWFVDHIQDGRDECQYAPVSLEQLAGLKVTCQRLLDSELAGALQTLPPRQGFFFGAYEVDEYYRADLLETVRQIEAVELVERERHANGQHPLQYWYQSSW